MANLVDYAQQQPAPATDLLRQKMQGNTGITGGLMGQPQPITAPGLQAAPAPAPPPGAHPAAPPPAAPPAPAQPAPMAVAAAPGAEPKPEGMSDQDWANFQLRYRPQGGAAAPGAPGAAPGAPAPSANPLGDVFRNALSARLTANPAPTSIADDPTLAAQSGAFRQASARDAARTRSEGVESLGAQGLGSSGAMGTMARKVNADRALSEGTFDANLLGGARDKRMQELQAFMGIAGNTLSNEEKNALDREMGNLDANVRREGIASQTQLGQGDLNLRGELGRGGLNQNLLSILLNNRTDNDRTALSGAGMELGANTAALQALMGGAR